MIPIKLTLQGLYSYQKKQVIDFTRLTQAHLFGIFGSVGSGKSTILEAITFALYGKTDRLNLSGDNRNYNMMNLKSNELFIEFLFTAGKDKQKYLITAKGKRNSKQFDIVRKIDRAAFKNTNNEWLPIEFTEIEDVIGLSYDNFKRTIIIPQGKFQEFLQLGNTDRTQMMKEIFNLGDYELYYKVKALELKNKERIQRLEGQLQQLGDINPQQVNEKKVELKNLEKEIKLHEESLKRNQKLKEELSELKILCDKRDSEQKKLQDLNKRKDDIIELEKRIVEFEKCVVDYKALFEAYDKNKNNIVKYRKIIVDNKKQLQTIIDDIENKKKKFHVLELEYQKKDDLKQTIDDLNKIQQLIELRESSDVLKKRSKKGEEVLEKKIREISELKREQEKIVQSLKKSESLLPDEEELLKVKEWYTKRKFLNENNLNISEEKKTIVGEMDEIINAISLLLPSEWDASISAKSDVSAINKVFDAKIEEATNQVRDIDAEIENLSVQTKLEEYVVALHDGEPCPLCGSVIHPKKMNSENVAELLFKARKHKQEVGEKISAIEKKKVQWGRYVSQLELKNKDKEKLERKQQEQLDKITKHNNLFVWDKYSEEKEVDIAFYRVKHLKNEIRNYSIKRENLIDSITKAENDKQKYSDAVNGFKQEILRNATESVTLEKQIVILNKRDYIDKAVSEIQMLVKEHSNKYTEIVDSYEKLSAEIVSLNNTKSNIEGSVKANELSLNSVELDYHDNEKKIDALIKKSHYNNSDEVRKVLLQQINVDSSKKQIEEYKFKLQESEGLLEQYGKQINNRHFNKEKYDEVVQIIAQTNDFLSNKNKQYGALHGEIKKLEDFLQKQILLVKELDELTLRGEDIKTMKALFKGSGFVNYVSSMYLQNLCNAANDRFYKLTRQRLSLEITEDNNFIVRDFMNGGRKRSVKTLSGGQTFQAALSLALALADNIQKISQSDENFFFLDEGFGALDPQSLEVVFDTLKSLRKENRIVGVISHVDDMRQEIDTHLKIVNDDDLGSIIQNSWEN